MTSAPKSATVADIREQVILRIAEVIRAAQEAGEGDGVAAARRAFPGTPEDVLHAAWWRVEEARTEEWWQQVERTIDAEVIDRALRLPGGAK
jgi:hypothetical protein